MTQQRLSQETYQSRLTYEQLCELLAPIDPNRVTQTQGNSNVEAYDIRAELNRIFGFANWDGEATRMELVNERWGENRQKNPAVSVVYRCQYRLTVYSVTGEKLATYTEWAMGDAANFPEFKYSDAHDFAAKTAESQAFKRCAMNLGDQFGLSLYRGGSTDPVVNWTLVQKLPPEYPVRDLREDRSSQNITPETDPDHGAAPTVSGPVDTQPRTWLRPANPPQTTEDWGDQFKAAASLGPVEFVKFIEYVYDVNTAPDTIYPALPKTLNKLNTQASQINEPTASYNFPEEGTQ